MSNTASVTTLDLAKLRNSADGGFHLIDGVGKDAPEVALFPASVIAGTDYDVTLVTSYPTVGFRKLNQGMTPSKATFETRKYQAMIIDALVTVDRAAANGHDKGVAHLQSVYSMLTAKGAMLAMGSQMFYGTEADANGFIGFKKHTTDNGLVIDATGSTADTGSSIYLVYAANDVGVELIWGGDNVLALSDFVEGQGLDAEGKQFPAYLANLCARPGLAVPNPNAISRIKNLTTQTGKGATDTLISQALELHPTGATPTMIFMNRRSRAQLQRSRTVTLQGNGKGGTGSQEGNTAPIPTEAFGIPIICTDSILNTEAIA